MAFPPAYEAWEADAFIRHSARERGRLTAWPTMASIGVPSSKACALNVKVLVILAKWWVQHEAGSAPKIIPVSVLRDQA